MHTLQASCGDARTYLTHLFGSGLEDDRYVAERFRAMANGDIRRLYGDEPAKTGQRRAERTIATLNAVRQMRPAYTEIIICTGRRIKGGIQIWGDIATPFLCDRKRFHRATERIARGQWPNCGKQPAADRSLCVRRLRRETPYRRARLLRASQRRRQALRRAQRGIQASQRPHGQPEAGLRAPRCRS